MRNLIDTARTAEDGRYLTRLLDEMGYRSLHILQTRYINMKGISSEDANQFWEQAKI